MTAPPVVTTPPPVTTAQAAFTDLPAAVSKLQTDLASTTTGTFATDLARASNDISLLLKNAASFTTQDRQRIDLALFADGLTLYFDGLTAFMTHPQEGFSTAALGAQSALGATFNEALIPISSPGAQRLT
jgi:hypothetical protein